LDKLSRFQLRLIDPREALMALVSGGLGLIALLVLLILWLQVPRLPELPVADGVCCLEGDRSCTSSVLDRLPTPAQLRSVRARQAFAQRVEEPSLAALVPMPSQAQRLSQIDYTEVLQLKELLSSSATELVHWEEYPADVRWLVALVSERDWSEIAEEPPQELLLVEAAPLPDGLLSPREHARHLALAEAEREVARLRQLEPRLREGLDIRLAGQIERVHLEGALLGPQISEHRAWVGQMGLGLGGMSALLLLFAAWCGWRARRTVLVLTPSRICAGGLERPASWLEDFELYSHETVLFGHDGTLWRLPPAPLPQLLDLEDALRLLCQPSAEAFEQERAEARRVHHTLAQLRARENQSR
jgi:hypothetical protein